MGPASPTRSASSVDRHRQRWSVRCGSQGKGRHEPCRAVPSAHHARAKGSYACSRWRVNEFKIGARGMHGPCEKRTRGSDSDRSLALALVTPVGWPAARAVPWPWPLLGRTGHAMCARERPWPRPRPACRLPFHHRSLPTISQLAVSSTAVLVCDTSSCGHLPEPVRGVRYEWHRPVFVLGC